MTDTRITCMTCTKIKPGGICGAAAKRERIDVGPRYRSIWMDEWHRCLWYVPDHRQEDQRAGRERFPELRADYERNRPKVDPWAASTEGIAKAKAAIAQS